MQIFGGVVWKIFSVKEEGLHFVVLTIALDSKSLHITDEVVEVLSRREGYVIPAPVVLHAIDHACTIFGVARKNRKRVNCDDHVVVEAESTIIVASDSIFGVVGNEQVENNVNHDEKKMEKGKNGFLE